MAHRSFDFHSARWRYPLFVIFAGFIACSANVSHLIADGFNAASFLLLHEGEYVGLLWHMRAYQGGAIEFPVLIHGAMDHIPSMLASFLYGDERVIVGTRVVNTFIVWACWVIFLDLCYVVVPRTSQRALWTAVALLALFLVTPKLGSQAVTFQQSFLGVRDLFLIATVWCGARYTYSTSKMRGQWFLVGAGASAAIAFFWCYDRGLLSLGFLGTVVFGLVVNRNYRAALITLMALCISAILLDQSRLLGSIYENVQNVAYWTKNAGEIAGTSVLGNRVTAVTALLVLCFCIAAIAWVFICKFYRSKPELFFILGILVTQGLLLKTVMTRPDMPRLSYAIWPSMLLMVYCGSRTQVRKLNFAYESAGPVVGSGAMMARALALVFGLMVFFMSPLLLSYGSFAKNVFTPKLDTQIVPAEVNQLVGELRRHGDRCVFGWVNEGVAALLLKQRFCTRFGYAMYVARDQELNYLQQLKADSPSAIVADVQGVTMLDIGSGQMRDRLPNVSSYIRTHYPHRVQIGRYTLATRGGPQGVTGPATNSSGFEQQEPRPIPGASVRNRQ